MGKPRKNMGKNNILLRKKGLEKGEYSVEYLVKSREII